MIGLMLCLTAAYMQGIKAGAQLMVILAFILKVLEE